MIRVVLFLAVLAVSALNITSASLPPARSSFTSQATSESNQFNAGPLFPVFATASATLTPTPTPTPTAVSAGDVVINEIHWAGSSRGISDEWIELLNTTTHDISIAGWKISGAVSGAGDLLIPSGVIPGYGFFLISHFSESDSIIAVTPDLITTDLQLDNSNAQYVLKTATNEIIDTADDGSGSPLAGSATPPKKSMERKTPPGDGTSNGKWKTATAQLNLDPTASESATPKAINSL